ncbi:MAG TPA: hypothetical protein VFO77_12135 [Actinoplanes sp.]|nr:hypothetical protein [Actinoplanes sp.]
MPANTRTCPICWNQFTPNGSNPDRHTYCSGRCRAEAGRRRARENTTTTTPAATPKPYHPEPAALRDCPHCGQPVTIVALLTTQQIAQQTPNAPNVVSLRAVRNN